MRWIVVAIVAVMGMTLSGCQFIVNMPSLAQQTAPVYRDTYVNNGVVYTACGGSVTVINESGMKVQVTRDDHAPNADRVRLGIPLEHLIAYGYDQYGQIAGRAERTFLCDKKWDVEQWRLTDPMLWWQLRQ